MYKVAKQSMKVFVLLAVVVSVLFVGYVLAAYAISSPGNKVNPDEDVRYTYNITITLNDTGVDANITFLNISFPAGFAYVNASNGTNAATGYTFKNYTDLTVITFNHSTGLITEGQNISFWFDVNATNPGFYNFSIAAVNMTDVIWTNYSIEVNDTTVPEIIIFNSPPTNGTPADGQTNISQGPMHIIPFSVNASDPWFNGTVYVSLLKLNAGAYEEVNNVTTTSTYNGYTNYFGGNGNGLYIINASFNDTYGNRNSTVTAVVLINDSTDPWPIVFQSDTNLSGENVTRNWIYVNVSVGNATSHTEGYEQNIKNITWRLYNLTTNASGQFTSHLLVNISVTGNGTTSFNWTNLDDGNYTYNLTVIDYGGNLNSSIDSQELQGSRNITIDSTAPSVVLAKQDAGTDKDTVVVDITITEGGTGVKGLCTVSGESDPVVTGSGTKAQTLTHGDDNSLACGKSFTYGVACSDHAGNGGTQEITVSTDACSSTGGSSSSSSKSSSTYTTTYTITKDQFAGGYTREVGEKAQVSIPVTSSTGGVSTHMVGVDSVSETTVKITVSSDPIKATLAIGDVRKFDVLGDGWYDIQVTLNKIVNSKADLTILAIHDPVTSEAMEEEEEQQEAAGAADPTPIVTDTGGKSNVIWMVLIIAVIAVVVFMVMKSKKGKSKKK